MRSLRRTNRRLGAVALSFVVLFAGACGEDSPDESSNTTNTMANKPRPVDGALEDPEAAMLAAQMAVRGTGIQGDYIFGSADWSGDERRPQFESDPETGSVTGVITPGVFAPDGSLFRFEMLDSSLVHQVYPVPYRGQDPEPAVVLDEADWASLGDQDPIVARLPRQEGQVVLGPATAEVLLRHPLDRVGDGMEYPEGRDWGSFDLRVRSQFSALGQSRFLALAAEGADKLTPFVVFEAPAGSEYVLVGSESPVWSDQVPRPDVLDQYICDPLEADRTVLFFERRDGTPGFADRIPLDSFELTGEAASLDLVDQIVFEVPEGAVLNTVATTFKDCTNQVGDTVGLGSGSASLVALPAFE